MRKSVKSTVNVLMNDQEWARLNVLVMKRSNEVGRPPRTTVVVREAVAEMADTDGQRRYSVFHHPPRTHNPRWTANEQH